MGVRRFAGRLDALKQPHRTVERSAHVPDREPFLGPVPLHAEPYGRPRFAQHCCRAITNLRYTRQQVGLAGAAQKRIRGGGQLRRRLRIAGVLRPPKQREHVRQP